MHVVIAGIAVVGVLTARNGIAAVIGAGFGVIAIEGSERRETRAPAKAILEDLSLRLLVERIEVAMLPPPAQRGQSIL